MRVAMATTAVLASLALAIFVGQAAAHSWVGCTDYRGSVNYYEEDKCFAYPRQWHSRAPYAIDPKGYQIGIDTGFNYQPPDDPNGAACQAARGSGNYQTAYPKAVYEVGGTYCLAWPMKNHGAATCTNQYIPDTTLKIFMSGVNPTKDPTSQQFKDGRTVETFFGKHENGKIDCVGFQRSPKFCDNTDRALGTGCFKVAEDLSPGEYTFQWYWIFNPGAPYVTCFDATVVAKGSGSSNGVGGLTGVPVSNMNGDQDLCKNAWDSAATNAPADDADDLPDKPADDDDAGDGDGGDGGDGGGGGGGGDDEGAPPDTPVTPTAPVEGNTVQFTKAPASLPSVTVGPIEPVEVAYSAKGDDGAQMVVVVDVLAYGEDGEVSWYGKSSKRVNANTNGKLDLSVDALSKPLSKPATGMFVPYLKAWIVRAEDYDKEPAKAYAYELDLAIRHLKISDPDAADADTEADAEADADADAGTGAGAADAGGVTGGNSAGRAVQSAAMLVSCVLALVALLF